MDFEFWRPHLRRSHLDAWQKLRATYGDKVGDVPRVEWSKRMTKTLGTAYYGAPDKPDFVRLSAVQFWQMPETYVLEVVPHELAHIAAWRVFEHSGHGRPWVQIMESMGFEGSNRFIDRDTIERHKRNFWIDK